MTLQALLGSLAAGSRTEARALPVRCDGAQPLQRLGHPAVRQHRGDKVQQREQRVGMGV
jgi:hypothetical protein